VKTPSLLCILIILGGFAGAEELPPPKDEGSPRIGLALAEAQALNLSLYAVDRYLIGYEWAQVSPDTIWRNLRSDWVWDQDSFAVNQLGHPYHGSLYFNAARANGLGFYGSTLAALSGSSVWELFLETELPSKNDLVATTIGGAALGEMLHRLYQAVEPSHPLAAALLSPMDAANRALGNEGGKEAEGAISEGELSLAAGLVDYRPALDASRGEADRDQDILGTFELRLAYGDPFGAASSIPYESFEQRLSLALSPSYRSIAFFSDGFLRSWALADSARRRASLGPSLHYDLIYSSDITFSAISLGLSWKSERGLPRGLRLRTRLHADWVALGASEYAFLSGEEGSSDEERREYDLGTGEGAKLGLELLHPRRGALILDYAFYGFHTIPASAPEEGYEGYAMIGMLSLALERALSPELSLGLAASLYHKSGVYEDAPDVEDATSFVNLYVKRRF